MPGTFWLISSYSTLAIFIAVCVCRCVKIARMPVHLRWELAPVPGEKSKSSYGGSYLEEFEWWTVPRETSRLNELWYMAREILFLKGVWDNNRALWIFSYPFHVAMYLLLLMLLLLLLAVLINPGPAFLNLFYIPASICAAAGYPLGILGSAGLLSKRLLDPAMRPFTTLTTYLSLLLPGAVFISGGAALLGAEPFLVPLRNYLEALMLADATAVLPPALAAHVVITLLFMLYLPFTFMIHFIAKYFTYHSIRWNDGPMNGEMERSVRELMEQPLIWSAPHVRGDGRKSWMDAAKEGFESEKNIKN